MRRGTFVNGGRCLPDLVFEHAGRSPERVAFTFLHENGTERSSITYRELSQRSLSLAAELRRRGLSGERALLLYAPGIEYIVALCACFSARVIAVPAYPPDPTRLARSLPRLEAIVADCTPRVVLTTEQIAQTAALVLDFAPGLREPAWVPTDRAPGKGVEPLAAPLSLEPDVLALIQYTSGSTGVPKGVMVTHQNICHNEELIRRCFDLSPESIVVGWLPFYHDMGLIGNVLQALYLGARCVLMSPASFLRTPRRWLEAISEFRGTISGGPNFAYDHCVRKVRDLEGLDLSSWRVAFNGSEPLRAQTLDRFVERFSPAGFRRRAFCPCYGLAEGTLMVAGVGPLEEPTVISVDQSLMGVGVVHELPTSDRSFVACGRTSADQEVAIVDPVSCTHLPEQVVGEIWVSGPSVAAGYFGKKAASEREFHARLESSPERTYLRTGDLGFVRRGELFIAGRCKDLIIIRGRNHYPQDIEATVEAAHPAVRRGCAAAFATELDGVERLGIAVEINAAELSGAGEPALERLVQALRHAVIDTHAIEPGVVVALEAGQIPKTSSGKVQRHMCARGVEDGSLGVLRRWSRESPVSLPTEAARDGAPESIVAEIAAVLEIAPKQLSAASPLRDLGLDSVGALEVAHILQERLGVAVSQLDLLNGLSLDEVLARRATPTPTPTPTPAPRNRTDSIEGCPASPAQQRMWVLHQLAPESARYNTACILKTEGQIDPERLRAALQTLVVRHTALRVGFDCTGKNGAIVHRELAGAVLPLAVSELDTDDDASAIALARREARRPYVLAAPPLARAALFQVGATRSIVVVCLHHIISDQWSSGILLEELAAAYDGRSLPGDADRYVEAVRDACRQAGDNPHLGWWRSYLKGAAQAIDFPREPAMKGPESSGRTSVTLSPMLWREVKQFASLQGTTPFVVLLSAVNIAVSRWAGVEDFVIGTVVADRREQSTRRVVGCFINFLPLRIKLGRDHSGIDVIRHTQQQVLDVLEHAAPFDRICRVGSAERGADSPLYNVALLYQRVPFSPRLSLAGGVAEARALQLEEALLDLRFVAEDTGHGLELACEYRQSQFRLSTANSVLALVERALCQLMQVPGALVTTLALDTELEAQRARMDAQHSQNIVVAASFTADPLGRVLEFWLRENGSRGRVAFAPYNQWLQQLLDPVSLFRQNGSGVNILLLRFEDLGDDSSSAADALDQLAGSLSAVARSASARFVVAMCPPSPSAMERFGVSFADQHSARLRAAWSPFPHVLVCEPREVLAKYPVLECYDAEADEIGRIPYTSQYFAALGSYIFRLLWTREQPAYKVLVLDCDGTLWQGICGEDGPQGIRIDAARAALQAELLRLRQQGMLLALCSKNNEADVRAAFDANDMPLRWEHLSALRINWQPKAANLRALAQELRLGLDSFIFVDDDPVECAQIMAVLPEVLTVQMPAEEHRIRGLLSGLWPLDHRATTAEDESRASFYREETARQEFASSGRDLAEVIRGLNLQVGFQPLSPETLPRAAQITARTNQFNLNGSSYREAELLSMLDHDARRCDVVTASDRFGAYGLVGMLLYRPHEGALLVEGLWLSCRALGRGVEARVLERLGQVARAHGCERINLDYRETRRNDPVRHLLSLVGATLSSRATSLSTELAEQSSERWHQRSMELSAPKDDTARSKSNDAAGPEPERPAPQGSDPQAASRAAFLLRAANQLHTPARILQAIESRAGRIRRCQEAPRDAVEELLAALWAESLHSSGVGLNDDFFALGGDSIGAAMLVARIRHALDVKLELVTFLQHSTVAGLAEVVRNEGNRSRVIPARGGDTTSPASFAQERLWLIGQLDPTSCANVVGALRAAGPLCLDALSRGIDALVLRHEVLRTCFAEIGGQLTASVREPFSPGLDLKDLSALVEPRRTREAERLAREYAATPFDPSVPRRMRALVVQLAPELALVVFALDHLIADGWSVRVLMDELATCYVAYTRGAHPELSELGVRYADYARWQRETASQLDDALARRLADLRGSPYELNLPVDHRRQAAPNFAGGEALLSVQCDALDEVKALAAAEGATVFMVLLSAWTVLLSRWTGDTAIVVGVPAAQRGNMALERSVGPFLNTLLVRIQIERRAPFRTVIRRVREATLAAYRDADVPFERLVEGLQAERRGQPLFRTICVLQPAPVGTSAMGDVRLERVPLFNGNAQTDLTLSLEQSESALSGAIEYSKALFESETVRRLAAGFCTLLRAAAADPDQRVEELPAMEEAERIRTLVSWNSTQFEPSGDVLPHRRFEAHAAARPQAVALREGGRVLQYGELNRRANQVARRLREKGVGPEDCVCILCDGGFERVIALLGVLKAGAAFVQASNLPSQRLAHVLLETSARVTICDAGTCPRIGPTCCLSIDDGVDDLAPSLNIEPGSLAYVIYTSGSTGQPKGVMVSHLSLSHRLAWGERTYPLRDADRMLQLASPAFDVAIWEILTALSRGAQLVLIPPTHDRADPAALVRLMIDEGITIVGMLPAVLRLVLEHPDAERLQSLRYVFSGAEALPASVAELFYRRLPLATLFNFYGLTETTIDATYHHCLPRGEQHIPIGKPIGNTGVYVLDDMQPVPIGVAGELYVGGVGLARGYLKQAAQTAARFIPNPFSSAPGGRLYATGDLVRWRDDGALVFLGRRDHQIKVRGQRVELAEVEAVLKNHESVRDAAVVVHGDQLVAFVAWQSPYGGDDVGRNGHELGVLQTYLAEHLPAYMVPGRLSSVASVPRLANGKIDRSSLPVASAGSELLPYRAPQHPLERVLAEVWRDLLGVERVGLGDNFFSLGGHSLSAARVVAMVRERCGVEVPLRSVFDAPTLERFARVIERGQPVVAEPSHESSSESVLSFAQQRLWLLSELAPGQVVHNLVGAVHLRGRLDTDALDRALGQVIRRHAVLRTRFVRGPSGPVLVVDEDERLALGVKEIQSFGACYDDAVLAAREFGSRPFDLANDWPVRALLIRLDLEEHLLVTVMHHIAADGWSIAILIDEVSKCYAAFHAGGLPDLSPLSLQYSDFAARERRNFTPDRLARSLEFWRQELSGANFSLHLPTDRARPVLLDPRGGSEPVNIDENLRDAVYALAQSDGATPFMVLLGAFQLVLHRWSGQRDLIVGTPIAGRHHVTLEGLIGCFVNTLPLRARLEGDMTFRQQLAGVRDVALRAYAHHDLQFDRLVEGLSPARDPGTTPIFQVLFTFQSMPTRPVQLPGVTAQDVDIDLGMTQFALGLELEESEERLSGILRYQTALFDAATARRFVSHFVRLLRAVVDEPDRSLSALSMLAPHELDELARWNATDGVYPSSCVHELIEMQTKLNPAAVAVADDSGELSYAMLELMAESLAARLRTLGVGPDCHVGVLLERSSRVVVTLLAIMKAGGAYVPLDLAAPTERSICVLRGAGVGVLVSESGLTAVAESLGVRNLVLVDDVTSSSPHRRPSSQLIPTPENIAYVLYTSGSTGEPKGVEVPHRALVNVLCSMRERLGMGAADCMLATTTLTFDIAGLELLLPLLVGARVVIASRDDVRDPRRLIEKLKACGPTYMQATPTYWQMLVEAGWTGLPPLTVLCGGEVLSRSLSSELQARTACLWNLYGPTETTIWSSLARVADVEEPSLGQPLANTRLHVLDEMLCPQPVGVPGELFIAGAGVARGYLGRPMLTAERFIPDPFSPAPGGRMYRTGDRVRRLVDGSLAFLGRSDNQIKLHGHRIELGEIESVLSSHPAAGEVAVILRNDAMQARLVAYWRGSVAEQELREFAKQRLPGYMVPSSFVRVESFPTTPNGKVDRPRLPAPQVQAATTDVTTDFEQRVALVWQNVLGLASVDADANFFDVGGTSLLAVTARAQLEAEFGREIALIDLFKAPSIRSFARLLDGVVASHTDEDPGEAKRGRQARARVLKRRSRGRDRA